MKRIILFYILIQSLSFGAETSNCEDYLKKADTALSNTTGKWQLEDHGEFALVSSAYMERYRLCMERVYGAVTPLSVKQDTGKLKSK